MSYERRLRSVLYRDRVFIIMFLVFVYGQLNCSADLDMFVKIMSIICRKVTFLKL